jgi:hypothetical protein
MDRGFTPLRIVLGILVIGVVALLGFLIFQGVKPTIKNPQPLNGSRTPKGDVTISAEVRGESNLRDVILTVDGRKVDATIITHSERYWEVRYQATLPKGTHQAEIVAIDTRGREQPYRWSFNASGPTNPPKFANPLPRNGADLARHLQRPDDDQLLQAVPRRQFPRLQPGHPRRRGRADHRPGAPHAHRRQGVQSHRRGG